MASNLGTVFVEISLDDKVFKQKLSETLTSTQATAKGIETSWRTLGTRCDAVYDAQRRSYENALILIKNSATSTAADIVRAEEAKNAKLKTLNDQQFGHQTSLLDSLKKNWIATTAAIAVAVGTIMKVWNLAKIGAEYEEQRDILDNLSRKYGMTAESIVSSMAAASEGLIAKSDLIQIALGGIAKGLKPDQLINLANAAKILGDAVGVNATTALRDLTEALETGRTKGLKNYLGTTLDLETAFGDLTSKMTATEKAQAMYSLTMITASKLQAEQTTQVGSAADKMERLDAQYKNVTLSLATFCKTLVVGVVDAFKENFKMVDAYSASLIEMEGGLIHVGDATKALTDSTNKEADATKAIIAPYQTQIDSLKKQLTARKANEEATKKGVAEQEAATKSITEAIRKSNAEIEGIGKSQYDKDIARIESEVEKYKKAGVGKVYIAKFVESETLIAKMKAAEETKKLQQKSNEDYWRALEKEKEEHEETIRKEYEQDRKYAEDLKKLGEKSAEEYYRALEKEMEEKAEIMRKEFEDEKRLSIERIKLESDIYEDIRGYDEEYYTAQKELIADRVKALKVAGVSEIAIKAWVDEEDRRATEKKILRSNDFFAGMKVGWQRYVEEEKTWAEVSGKIVYDMAKNCSKQISDNLFNVLTGKFNKLKFDWNSLWEVMLRTLTDKLADMAVKAAESELWDLLGGTKGLLSTGISWVGSLFAKKGIWEVGGAKEGIPVIAHKGEMIIPANLADLLRGFVLNLPTGPGGSVEAAQGAAIAAILKAGLSAAGGMAAGAAGGGAAIVAGSVTGPGIEALVGTLSEAAGISAGGMTLATLSLGGIGYMTAFALPAIMGMLGGALGWGEEQTQAEFAVQQQRRYLAVYPGLQRYVSGLLKNAIKPIPEINAYIERLKQQQEWFAAGMVLVPGVAPSDEAFRAMVTNRLLSIQEQSQYIKESYAAPMGQEARAWAPSSLMYDPNAQTTWQVMGPEHPETYTGTMRERYGNLLRQAGYDPDIPTALELVQHLEEIAGYSGGQFGKGGLAYRPSIFGEGGPEWAVPTYEPERSKFLRDVGVDLPAIADALAKRLPGNGGGIVINSPLISIEGNLVADQQVFDEFVEKIDYALDKRGKRTYKS